MNIGFIYCWRFFTTVSGEHVPQKGYRRHVASILIRSSTLSMEVGSRPARSFKVADEIRLDGVGHYPILGSVRKCFLCKKSCRNQCEKFEISAYVNTCFQSLIIKILLTLCSNRMFHERRLFTH